MGDLLHSACNEQVDARATTNIKIMSDEERMKLKAEEEARARAEIAAAAALLQANKEGRESEGEVKVVNNTKMQSRTAFVASSSLLLVGPWPLSYQTVFHVWR